MCVCMCAHVLIVFILDDPPRSQVPIATKGLVRATILVPVLNFKKDDACPHAMSSRHCLPGHVVSQRTFHHESSSSTLQRC